MYSEKFMTKPPPSVSAAGPALAPSHPAVLSPGSASAACGDSDPRHSVDMPTIHSLSRLTRLQHNPIANNSNSNGSASSSKSVQDKPVSRI